jgi:nucleotide-binding universal stress UspA family protein
MTDPQNQPSPTSCYRPLRTVVIGTSLGEESDPVVRAGLAVARAAGARVHLVHAAEIEPVFVGFEAGLAPQFSQQQIAWRREGLRQQIARLGVDRPELAGITVEMGVPYRILLEAARAAGADLIVVGATESGAFAAEVLGSTADRVIRKSACPVLVARGDLAVPPRRVLAPVDLSELSRDTFRCAMDFLGQVSRGATEVRVLYALSFLDALARHHESAREIPVDEMERVATEELRRLVRESGAAFSVETAVRSGEARQEILRDLGEHPADLVVIGTHGRGGVDRLVLGSVAATVARKAPCSVLLFSPDAVLAEGLAEAVANETSPD